MWEVVGEAKKIQKPIIVRYSEKFGFFDFFNKGKVFNVDKCLIKGFNFCGVSCKNFESVSNYPIVYNIPENKLKEINTGDILKIYPSGKVKRLWNTLSSHNALFLTEKCNSNCIMCPQPQEPIDHDNEIFDILNLLKEDEVSEICITGGEPTVNGKLPEVLQKLKKFSKCKPIV